MDNIDINSIPFEEIQKFTYGILEKYNNFIIMNPHCPFEDFLKYSMNGQINPSNTNLISEHGHDIRHFMNHAKGFLNSINDRQITPSYNNLYQAPQYNQVRFILFYILLIFFERVYIYV